MGYHYESHTSYTNHLDGTQTRSSVIVRELDDGEVGILLAGNNSIVDPSLTPHMLAVATADYDVENAPLSPSPSPEDDTDDIDTSDEDDEHWFPSLRHNSWIEGLDEDDEDDDDGDDGDGDDIMTDKMIEHLFATAIMENDDDDQHSKSRQDDRRTTRRFERQQNEAIWTRSGSRKGRWMDEESEDDSLVRLVPVDIIYVMLN
ncbi:hypothetical protein BCR42DRAFT_406290, partial [Absidia repens]